MRHDNDCEYFQRREAAERALAAHAGNPVISRVHLQMADEYARKLAQAEGSTLSMAAAR